MQHLLRILLMTVVTLFLISIGMGGYGSLRDFGVVALIYVFFGGLPALGFVTFLQLIEGVLRRPGKYVCALPGLMTIGLVLHAGAGDPVYERVIIVCGILWSLAWIGTWHLFFGTGKKISS
jgi:hypothetical protein